jgi:hypothetical protein
LKIKIVSCHTADSKSVKQEVNGTIILPPLVFPALPIQDQILQRRSQHRDRCRCRCRSSVGAEIFRRKYRRGRIWEMEFLKKLLSNLMQAS